MPGQSYQDKSLAMKRKLGLLPLLMLPIVVFGQSVQDSVLLEFLSENRSTLEEMVSNYRKFTVTWPQLLVTFGGFIFLAGLTWRLWGKQKLKEYLQKKSQEAVDLLTDLKTSGILVLSGKDSSDKFLRSFFREKRFTAVKFLPIDDKKVEVKEFEYSLVFANNEDGKLDKSIVRQYLDKETALFYFGKSGTWDYQNDAPEISIKINFANSRAQIYGNLMSSLEFLALVRPRIRNV